MSISPSALEFLKGVQAASDPVTRFESALQIPARPFQSDLLNSTSQRVICMASRQLGKSSVVACLVWDAFMAGKTCVIIAPTEKQAKEFLLRVKDFRDADPFAPIGTQFLKTEVHAPNHRGRILAMPATDGARGFTADFLVLDEAALIDDELIAAVLPMRKKETGRLIVISTPMWRSGFFHDRWHDPANDFQKLRGHFREQASPGLVELIEKERHDLGPSRFQREYELVFAGSGESAIPLAALHAAINTEKQAIVL